MSEVKKILVAVDLSENSKKILQHAVTVARQLDAKIVVIYVAGGCEDYAGLTNPRISLTELEKELVQNAINRMESFLEENMDLPVAYKSKVLCGDIVEKINNLAESEGVDMIIMGTHGYKGLNKFLFGSVAEVVIKTAHCPVLTINPYK